MWKQLYEWAKWLFLLAQETRRNRADIKELQDELEELTAIVQELVYEARRNKENETHEREKLVLRLENELLRFERRLTSAKGKTKSGAKSKSKDEGEDEDEE
jgi:hypothetical protein